MNFNKDNEQKLVKRQNKKCYDKILLMFLSFPTRGSPLLLELLIVTQANGSFLDLCHGDTSNWSMRHFSFSTQLIYNIVIHHHNHSRIQTFYRFKTNAAGRLVIVSWWCPGAHLGHVQPDSDLRALS